MHRNTYLLVTVLAVFAALVVGVNIGKTLKPTVETPAALSPTPTPPRTTEPMVYTNTSCGFALTFPSTLTLMDSATRSALLIHESDTEQSVALACQADIPRPPLTGDKIETLTLYNEAKTASVTARLYHDASANDGTPIDQLIFTHPTTSMDVFIAGFGETFDQLIKTIKLLP
jgi:hypothetical protein